MPESSDDTKLLHAVIEGNPGAMDVLYKLGFQYGERLVKLNITGRFLWMLYSDVCGKDIKRTAAVITALEKDTDYATPIAREGDKTLPVLKYLRVKA